MLLDRYSRFLLRHRIRFRAERNHGIPLPFQSQNGTQDVERALRDRADKADDEAVAVSAHLFLNLDVIGDGHPTYRAIMEEVPGLGRSYVHHVIADILRNTTYLYTDRHGDSKETYTLLDFHGIKSDTIGDAMSGSVVPFVQLVRPGRLEGFDTEGMVVPRDERMTVSIQATPGNTLAVLNRLKEWAFGNDWNDVFVQVALPEHRTRVVPISRTEDAADVLFIRAEQVDVEHPMDPCTDTINEELTAKAVAIFANAAGWA